MSTESPRHSSWVPTRPELLDMAFVTGLMLLGLVGLGAVYGGSSYLVVGLFGTVLGLVIAHAAIRLRAPWVFLSLAVMLCYFLLAGAVALRGHGGGPVPDVATIRSLADVVHNGWRQLISVAPPVGATGALLALPYLMGLVGAVVSYSLARRANAWAPLVSLAVVLVASILLGGLEPFNLELQGALYFGVAALYLAIRVRRRQELVNQSGRYRLVAPVAVLALSGVAGLALAPVLANAGVQNRVVLRESLVPPFDPHDWVSPLAELRHWELPGSDGMGDQVLFTVQPVPTSVVRFATMDEYDGTVYNVAGDPGPPRPGIDASSSGWFQPVGPNFAPDSSTAKLPTATYTITVEKYRGIWLPTIGEPSAINFSGPHSSALATTLRYNSTTGGAVAGLTGQPNQGGLTGSDGYVLTTALHPTDVAGASGTVDASIAAQPGIGGAAALEVSTPAPTGPQIKGMSDILAKAGATATGPYNRAAALAAFLTGQSLSSGKQGEQPSVAGHSVRRLADLVASDPWIGNAEQFSALMALLLTAGDKTPIPARVVVGVRQVPADGQVRGQDVTAWVEVGIKGYGWVPFFPTPAKPNIRKQQPGLTNNVPDPPPPPASPRLKSALAGSQPNATDSSAKNSNKPAQDAGSWTSVLLLVGAVLVPPLVLLVLPAVCLLFIKQRRRRRRQSSGEGSERIVGGWDEVIDWARDTGRDIPGRRTRREVAGAVALADPPVDLATLASSADRAVFAPESPTEADVEGYWSDVDTARARLIAGLPLWRRTWARISPVSLRSHDRASPR